MPQPMEVEHEVGLVSISTSVDEVAHEAAGALRIRVEAADALDVRLVQVEAI